MGILFGAGIAVVLRIVLTAFAIQLLEVKLVKLVGGALILWIAVKLFSQAAPSEKVLSKAQSLWGAIWIITLADITMSADNILAIAGISKGNLVLLILGLGLSIPFVAFSSGLLARLMDRYPIVILIGAAILGRVAGEMIITDPFTLHALHPSVAVQYCVEAFCAIGVIGLGKFFVRGDGPPGIQKVPKVTTRLESGKGRNNG